MAAPPKQNQLEGQSRPTIALSISAERGWCNNRKLISLDNLNLSKPTQSKLHLGILSVLEPSGCPGQDRNINEAFADVIAFGGNFSLGEVFTLSDALADFVFSETGETGRYLQISVEELTMSVGSQPLAIAALRLNGFVSAKKGNVWTNAPDGGRGRDAKIPEDFFASYLRVWADIV